MKLQHLKNLPPWEWPDTAGQFLLDILKNPRTGETDLATAAGLAGDVTVINDPLVHALLLLLRNEAKSADLRGLAALSFGAILEDAGTMGVEDTEISEESFEEIKSTLRTLYLDAKTPRETRRRILEAAVRSQEDWQTDAIRAAYQSGDESWKLTAVFCMQFVKGFDEQILEALNSKNRDIHYEAVLAAGAWELDRAWAHISALVTPKTEKTLLLAAIEAVSQIRPKPSLALLAPLSASRDEDIRGAVEEATMMVEAADGGFESDNDDE